MKEKKESKFKKIAGWFLRLPKRINVTVTVLLITATLISYASTVLNPGKYTAIPAFAGLGFPYILFVDVFYTMLLIFAKKWTAVFMILTIAFGYKRIDETVQLNPIHYLEDFSKEDSSFTFMSFNVRLLDRYNWIDSKGGTKNKIFEFLKYESPEIICFQEFYNNSKDSLPNCELIRDILKTDYVIRDYDEKDTVHKTDKGYIIFSKYPLCNRRPIFDFTDNMIGMSVDADIFGKKVRIFNIHLKSIKLGYDDYDFIDKIENKNNKEQLSGLGNIFTKISKAYQIRVKQAEYLSILIKQSPYPVILSGDFNEPPVSYCYNKIRKSGLEDAFCMSGTGFGETMRVKFLHFRIDYILHSKVIESKRFRTHRENLSDHYAVSCKFQYSGQ